MKRLSIAISKKPKTCNKLLAVHPLMWLLWCRGLFEVGWLRLSPTCLICGFALIASVPLVGGQNNHPPIPIQRYIAESWDILTRSTEECASYADSKVTLSQPTLYIPNDFVKDDAFTQFEHRCQVNVFRLPRTIMKLDDVPASSLTQNGLLYLPKPYVVPGGRFNEMYGWDSYFIELGLLADHRKDLAKDMLDNFLFEVENYGGVLNANRSYYLSRSQPPFLAEMIVLYFQQMPSNGMADDADRVWLNRAYRDAERAYNLWLEPKHRAGGTGLSRYQDYEEGPVPEMADDKEYYPNVVQWLQHHPSEHPEYLVPKKSDVAQSKLSDVFYGGDRADRESGFDTTFRFGPFSGSTNHFAPICLNSLLFRYEEDMAKLANNLGKPQAATKWATRARRRKLAMNTFLWSKHLGRFVDYDYVDKTQSTYLYITSFYPLWAGVATPEQARITTHALTKLELAHGMQMSTTISGLQWDAPFGWAPCNWIVADGLRRYGFFDDAARVSRKFTNTVETNYMSEGTIREKYNVADGTTSIEVSNGYHQNVTGFGWTNGVYLAMKHLLRER
jgi:alpha,alpha-trehalase